MRGLPVGFAILTLAFVLWGCEGTSHSEGQPGTTRTQDGFGNGVEEERVSLLNAFDSTLVSEATFEATLGTGRETYMPLDDGDTLFLELGHQGLQHVLVSIRLHGLPQDRYTVDLVLVREDGVAVSEPAHVRLPFALMADESGVELLGYTLVVVDPVLGVGHDALLRIAVEGPEGDIAVDERNVHVEWAPEDWNPDA